MWIPRQHVPVMAVTFVAPFLTVAAMVVVPLPHGEPPARCPHCGQASLHAGSRPRGAASAEPRAREPSQASWGAPTRD